MLSWDVRVIPIVSNFTLATQDRVMRAFSIRAVFTVLLLLGTAAGQVPVKLDVRADRHAARPGEQVPIRIRLLDAANRPAKAPKTLVVLLQARLASGEVKSLGTAELQPGDTSKDLTVTPPGAGLVYIWAKHPELLPGGAFVAVRSRAAPAPGGARLALGPAAPLARELPRLALRYSPDRRFLADGNDAATVQAFLLSDPASVASDIRLNVYDSSGTLQPKPLAIPFGQESGQAALTFTSPGTVTVEFLGSTPAATLDGDKRLQIQFMPAITRLALESSPPGISLVDTADLVVTLTNDQGRPIATDTARHVTFAIASGRGEMTREELDIAPGKFQARTTFQPVWLGRSEVSAATPNLLMVSAPVQVSAPTGLLLFSLAGGLAGGYLSYLKQKRAGPKRIAIGLLTGFIFYWACLFLGLASVGHAVVVNPMSAFALSTLGGWMQTEVFTFLKSRIVKAKK